MGAPSTYICEIGPNGVGRIDLNGGGVTDGQIGDPLYYNLNNDLSGNCNGDSGTINVKSGDGTIASYSIICAHCSNCISMSFDYIDTHIDSTGATYVVVRAINIKPPTGDRILAGTTTSPALAQDWVNLGYKGSGAMALGRPFPEQPITAGNWTLTPKPAVCRVRFP